MIKTVSFVIFALFMLPVFYVQSAAYSSGLTWNPEKIYTTRHGKNDLTIEGGLPAYRWYCTSGSVEKIDEHHFRYTAPGRYGDDSITFEDRAGQKAEIRVRVLRPLSISPSTLNLYINETTEIRISGGSGQWSVAAHSDFEILECTSSSIKIKTVGETVGLKKLELQDNVTLEIKEITINVFDVIQINVQEQKI